MKKSVILPLILLMALIMTSTSFGNVELSNESKYGMPVRFNIAPYPGDITIDGLYVYKDKEEYIFTLVYSNGKPATERVKGRDMVRTAFFNPPGGSIVNTSTAYEPDRITWEGNKIRYRIDAGKLPQAELITIGLYDVLHNNDKERLILTFKVENINFDKIPTADDLTKGYEVTTEPVSPKLPTAPAAWALKDIEELKISGVLRDAAFDQYEKNITRLRFVYLMTALYEKLTGSIISADGFTTFADTNDIYALKAAKIGITSGVGGNLFGPDRELSREEMAAFVVRTLKLAGVKLYYDTAPAGFADDADISAWASEPVYTAKYFDIIGSTGGNKFSPKLPATNQQALVIVRRLLGRFGGLEWYKEADGSRFYLRFEEKLYKISLGKNFILSGTPGEKDLFCMSLGDINTLLNLAHLKTYDLKYDATDNPNFAGMIKAHEYGHMDQTAANVYSGVDKIGETSTISFSSGFNSNTVTASVTTNDKLGSASYSGFAKINYYDSADKRSQMYALPIKDIFAALGIDYSIEYNRAWNIYIIEFKPTT